MPGLKGKNAFGKISQRIEISINFQIFMNNKTIGQDDYTPRLYLQGTPGLPGFK